MTSPVAEVRVIFTSDENFLFLIVQLHVKHTGKDSCHALCQFSPTQARQLFPVPNHIFHPLHVELSFLLHRCKGLQEPHSHAWPVHSLKYCMQHCLIALTAPTHLESVRLVVEYRIIQVKFRFHAMSQIEVCL